MVTIKRERLAGDAIAAASAASVGGPDSAASRSLERRREGVAEDPEFEAIGGERTRLLRRMGHAV